MHLNVNPSQEVAKSNLERFFDKKELLNRQTKVYDIVDEIINTMSEGAIAELFEGGEKDVDDVFFALEETVYDSLYGALEPKADAIDSIKQFENLSKDMEEMMRLTDPAYFIQSCIPQFRFSWFHTEWSSFATAYHRLCIIAARDTGKSYFWTMAYIAWKMYRYRNPATYRGVMAEELAASHRGILITNAIGLAKIQLEILKGVIEDSPILSEKLYNGVGKNDWGKERIKCSNGAVLQCYGAAGKIRGEHPGYGVVDDFLNDSSIYSQEQREKYITTFTGVIMNAVNRGQLIVVGTPFADSDLYTSLRQKESPFKVFTYPAIYPDGQLLDPKQNSYESIMEKKGLFTSSVFAREMLCMPISSDSSIFPNSTINVATLGMENKTLTSNRIGVKEDFRAIIMGCDFAMGSNADSDYSVFTTWGIDKQDRMWLLDMYREKGRDYNQQCIDILNIYKRFRHDEIIMEVNGFQDIFAQFGRKNDLPVVPHNTNRHNKRSLEKGVPGLAMKMQQGRVKLPIGDARSRMVTDTICGELQGMSWAENKVQGVSRHDDCAMSTWIASTFLDKEIDAGFGFMMI